MRFLAVLFLTASALFMEAAAAPKPYLRNGNVDAALDTEGIKFTTMKGSSSSPVPFPDPAGSISYKKTPSKRVDLYDKNALWRYEQTLGRWFGPGGSISLVKIRLPFPENLEELYPVRPELVRKEEFQNWMESAKLQLDDEPQLVEWLANFTATKVRKDDAFRNKKNKIEIIHYICDDPYKDAYYLAAPGNPERKYVLIFDLDKNSDIKKSLKNTPSIAFTATFFQPKTVSSEDKKLVTRKTSEIKDRSPEYIASRDKVVESIKNLPGWWYIETDNYIFTADLEDRKLIDELQTQVEKCRAVYEKYFEPKGPINKISVVKSFNSRTQYLNYIEDKNSLTIGIWMPAKEELVISPISGNKRENREEMVRILYHEGFHQYISYACSMLSPAPWFNEGHATFFEGLEFKNRSMELDITQRLAEFSSSMGGNISANMLTKLIQMNYEHFYSKETYSKNYSSAWAVTYFMNKGAPIIGKPEYAEIPFKYYEALNHLKNPKKATEEAWEGIDLDAFTSEMNKFYGSKKLLKKAEKYDFMKNKDLMKTSSAPAKTP